MCCKHCGGQPGFGRFFPNSVRSLAQTTTSQTILKHIGGKCRFCPPTIRKAVVELQRQQAHKEGLATTRPRYGSRKIFFQRMWARLHGKKQPDELGHEPDDDDDENDDDAREDAVAADNASEGSVADDKVHLSLQVNEKEDLQDSSLRDNNGSTDIGPAVCGRSQESFDEGDDSNNKAEIVAI
jgi:hypothetical protein